MKKEKEAKPTSKVKEYYGKIKKDDLIATVMTLSSQNTAYQQAIDKQNKLFKDYLNNMGKEIVDMTSLCTDAIKTTNNRTRVLARTNGLLWGVIAVQLATIIVLLLLIWG